MSRPLPTGTVTFLFTDIEGSTRLVDELGPRYPALLSRQAAIVRTAIEQHGGTVFGTEGDATFAVFASASAALDAAASLTRSLAAEPWPDGRDVLVRVGLHTGDGVVADGTYVGIDVHRVARIAGAAHGGQIVLSSTTRSLAEGAMPPGVTLRDLGRHRLKDITQPEHLWQASVAGLRDEFPALRSLGSFETNIPTQLTSFVGRERELGEVVALAAANRLVTLTGVGGTGKTRLLFEAGGRLVAQHPDGVWVVDLASITDGGLIGAQLTRCLGLGEEPRRDPIETALDYLRGKSTLILVDNCEHLIAAVAELVLRLLDGSPTTRVMTTSREALGVSGEAIYQVPSLALPPALPDGPGPGAGTADAGPDGIDLVDIEASEAVRLFVERVRGVDPGFRLGLGNARSVVDICRRLDGIPLALELAAARATVLSIEEIDEGLGDRFRLLTGGRRGALPRQQTLHALIDWSWDLLSAADQRLLARLAVFAGGWTLDAATAVTSDPDLPPDRFAMLDGLGRLVDRSLVLVERGEPTRYSMLETIRQYGLDRLVAAGEGDALRGRHLSFFLDLSQRASGPLKGPDMLAWLRRLDADRDNLRAALDWGIEAEPARAVAMTLALVPFWRSRAYESEATERIVRAAGVADALLRVDPSALDHVVVAHLFAAAAQAQAFWGDAERGPDRAEKAVALAAGTADALAVADALGSKAIAAIFSGHGGRSSALFDEAIPLAEEHGDLWMAAMMQAAASQVEIEAGDVEAAVRRIERATEIADRIGNPAALAFISIGRGRIEGHAGRIDEARRSFERATALYRQIGDRRFELVARSDLGHALRRTGAADEAEEVHRSTIREWLRLGDRGAIAHQLETFAYTALGRGEDERAATLLGAAAGLRAAAASTMLGPERAEYDAAVSRLRAAMSDEAFRASWAAGAALTSAQAVDLAVGGR